MKQGPQRRAGRAKARELRFRSILLALLLAVLIPTVCVLWFMNRAMSNERWAVRQKLVDAYRGQLLLVQEKLDGHWRETAGKLERFAANHPPARAFAEAVGAGVADSVLIYSAAGQLLYPREASHEPAEASEKPELWLDAQLLEGSNPTAAAAKYHELAGELQSTAQLARAVQAEARCRIAAGETGRAAALVLARFGEERLRNATDDEGRIIAANAELMILELDRESTILRRRLEQRLRSYDDSPMPSAQRRFLMRELGTLFPDILFPTLSAEELAAAFLDDRQSAEPPPLVLSGGPGTWQFATPNQTTVGLFAGANLSPRIQAEASRFLQAAEVHLLAWAPGLSPRGDNVLVSGDAGATLPGWRLTLELKDHRLFDAAAARQNAVYLWSGLLVIATMAGLALLAARLLQHQWRATRLKNDLVATVSHELKTPLASMRLLVDTLLEDDHPDPAKVREYLGLIARENTRLSRLIDNFLAFSRMERNKHAFELTPVDVTSLIEPAIAAAHERLQAAGCQFTTVVDPELPKVMADGDALITVLVNLLDNACKYSGDDKRIALRAERRNGSVVLEVEDHGIGMSSQETRKVFEGFYQVDQRLSRSSGGVGLGLSIVRYIVAAHAGTIHVSSTPGRGSLFTITFPALAEEPVAATLS